MSEAVYPVGIVGGGFGALLTHTALRYLGFESREIVVLGDQPDPVATYRAFAWGLGQTVLRSESESHFLPADWPTFAVMDLLARRRLSAVRRSISRTFNPAVPDILAEAHAVAELTGYAQSFARCRVGEVIRGEGRAGPHFGLYDEEGRLRARARHVLLAMGHGPLAFPGVLGTARRDPALAARIVQAYEPKRYRPGGRYVVVGSGIAGVNEWVNVLLAGAECIALRRTPEPDEQDLNVPRCLFEAYGIDAYQRLDHAQRLQILAKVLKGTTPERRGWQELIAEGYRKGTFREVIGEITEVRSGPEGLVVDIRLGAGGTTGPLHVVGVSCATGFDKASASVPILRRLIERYDPPMEGPRIALDSNCGVPPLDRPDSRLAMIGIHANIVVPNGDTIAGLKYIARRFAADVLRAEGRRRRPFLARTRMHFRCTRRAVADIRALPDTPQLS
ncbi:MAG: hypothetical protein MUE51_14805 [Thermoleophilia bacterium]|nr:hypothetical protein [Thermoleophilia bacterium]